LNHLIKTGEFTTYRLISWKSFVKAEQVSSIKDLVYGKACQCQKISNLSEDVLYFKQNLLNTQLILWSRHWKLSKEVVNKEK
jgi:hypothetical protein